MTNAMIKLSDFLTPDEIARAVALYDEATSQGFSFAARCEAEIIAPVLPRINATLGQGNHAKYLAYAVEFAIMSKRPPAPSQRR